MFRTLFRKATGRTRPSNERAAPPRNRVALAVEALEERALMDAGLGSLLQTNVSNIVLDQIAWFTPTPPALNSNPGAARTLYLDFDGHFEAAWSSDGMSFTNVSTQVFDTDGNHFSFSASEQALIREIWARVAEDYAPFDINVTTVEPPSFANGVAMRVAIGATNMGFTNSGYASIGSFTDEQPNVVYVFADNILSWVSAGNTDADGRPFQAGAAIATTASHEAGHAFGLEHQRVFSGATVVTNYNPGSNVWTPIMGDNLCSDRTTWSNGVVDVRTVRIGWFTLNVPVRADEMATLGNVLGWRADDVSNWASSAKPLSVSRGSILRPPSFNASGIIGKMSDVDYYSFQVTQAGRVSIRLEVAQFGPNLDSVLTLYRWKTVMVNGFAIRTLVQVAQDSPGNLGTGTAVTLRLGAQLNPTLGVGEYVIAVSSTGEYGSVGQYTLSGSLPGFTIGVLQPVSLAPVAPLPGPGTAPLASRSLTMSLTSAGAGPTAGAFTGAVLPAGSARLADTAAADRWFAAEGAKASPKLFGADDLALRWKL